MKFPKTSHLERLARGLKKVNPNNSLLTVIREKYKQIHADKPTSKPLIHENVESTKFDLPVNSGESVDKERLRPEGS
jgi:hypothetical protein